MQNSTENFKNLDKNDTGWPLPAINVITICKEQGIAKLLLNTRQYDTI